MIGGNRWEKLKGIKQGEERWRERAIKRKVRVLLFSLSIMTV